LIKEEYWTFIHRNSHWHNDQKLKEKPNQHWDDKYLKPKKKKKRIDHQRTNENLCIIKRLGSVN
jgi:hypothetical protein